MSVFPWARFLGVPRLEPTTNRRRFFSAADRDAAVLCAVNAGARSKTAIHRATRGNKRLVLAAVDALEARGVLVRGPGGQYEVTT